MQRRQHPNLTCVSAILFVFSLTKRYITEFTIMLLMYDSLSENLLIFFQLKAE